MSCFPDHSVSFLFAFYFTEFSAPFIAYTFIPFSHFLGPKLTVVTSWYEFYHQVVRGGRFYEKIEDMHRKYGPCNAFLRIAS
jgi:hypothetical protein